MDFDATDEFCLDSEKLIKIAGSGCNLVEYRTERNPFARIVSYCDASGRTFSVWGKDGRKSTYRGVVANRVKQLYNLELAVDGTVTPIFVLDQVEDRYGNFIKYSYNDVSWSLEPHGLHLYPEAIEYGFTNVPTRKVEFVYEDRPDPYFEYQNGVRFETTKRLSEVRTWAPASQLDPTPTRVLTYKLAYEPLSQCIDLPCSTPTPPSWRSRLAGISKCDGAGAVCGWQRQFEWQKQMPTFSVHAPPANEHDDQAKTAVVLDLDGDGRDDVLYRTWDDFPIHFVRFGTADGLGPPTVADIPAPPAGVHMMRLDIPASRPLDVDGDGTSELYATFRLPTAVYGEYSLHYAIIHWNASSSAFVVNGPVIDGPTSASVVDTVRVLDLDGDARPDVLRRAGSDPSALEWVYHENVNGQLGNAIPTGMAANCFERTRVGDLDGDGRGDILGYSASEVDECILSVGLKIDDSYQFVESPRWMLWPSRLPQHPTYNSHPPIVMVDANGDGLKDVVYPSGEEYSTPHISWNTGNGFSDPRGLPSGPHDDSFYHANSQINDYWYVDGNRVADVNGDGIEDVVSFLGEIDEWLGTVPSIEVHLGGRGESGYWGGFQSFTLPHAGGYRHKAAQGLPQKFTAGWSTSQLGDFNGDGLVDIVQLTPEPVDPRHLEVLLQDAAAGDVIVKIRDENALPDPTHAREQVFYAPEWRGPTATPVTGCAYPQLCFQRGMPVVRAHYLSQGEAVGAFRRSEYDYDDPRFDLQGRGFLGFGMMRARDPDLPREVITTFDHATRIGTIYPRAGLPEVVTTIAPILEQPADWPGQQPPGPRIRARVTKLATQYEMRSPPATPVYFVYPSRWTSTEWEEYVSLEPDRIVLLEYPNAPVIRRRTGDSTYDDYGCWWRCSSPPAGGGVRPPPAGPRT